jgi:hypothetical protein
VNATKAPNFTRENAAEMARRATRSRLARIEREKQIEATRQATRAAGPDTDDARRARVQRQIDLLLTDMETAATLTQRLKLGSAIERLWRLVQPTMAAVKPGRRAILAQPVALPTGSYQPDP